MEVLATHGRKMNNETGDLVYAILECPFLLDGNASDRSESGRFPRSGTEHQQDFLVPGNGNSLLSPVIHESE